MYFAQRLKHSTNEWEIVYQGMNYYDAEYIYSNMLNTPIRIIHVDLQVENSKMIVIKEK